MPYRVLSEKILGKALKYLGKDPHKNVKYVLKAMDHIASGEKLIMVQNWLHAWMREDGPGQLFLQRLARNTHPRIRERSVARMVSSMFFRDPRTIERMKQEYGFSPPPTMLISPTMRCNYQCEGCYAGKYEQEGDMDPNVFDRILTEGEEMGMNFFTILGGEPLIYPHLFAVLEKHQNSLFQIFTNASLIDDRITDQLVKLGNIIPVISINGPRKITNKVRRQGAFESCVNAMEKLQEAGCVFGSSALLTRKNIDVICSDEWFDFLIDKGVLLSWLFLYMPVGSQPNMELMPTPKQRNQMRRFQRYVRKEKSILLVDFWNDGVLTGGCIGGGRLYFHVNHRGDVEPCIFCHFATENIHEKSLLEALSSPFFKAIRSKQPFNYNTLRPCPIIDHPQVMWDMIQGHGAQPTHKGAEKLFTNNSDEINEYAARVKQLMDNAWKNDSYANWASPWMHHCGLPPEQIKQRRLEFERDQEKDL